MEVKEFKEELNKLGVEDPETQTAKLINVIYDTKDPVLQEMISTSNINEFISAYLKNTLVELKSSSKDFDAILKDSNKRVEKVKSESKTYVSKKIEIENKSKNEERISNDNSTLKEEIKINIEEYRSLTIEQRAKRNASNFTEILGYTPKETEGIEEFSSLIEEINGLIKNHTPENDEKLKKLLGKVKSISLEDERNIALKDTLEMLKKEFGIDISEMSLDKKSDKEIERWTGIISDALEILDVLGAQELSEPNIEEIVEEGILNLEYIQGIDKIKSVYKGYKDRIIVNDRRFKKYEANSYKLEKKVETIEDEKDMQQMDSVHKEEMEMLPTLSSDDMWARIEASMEHALEMQELAEDEPLTNSEGDKAIEENGEELDDSGIDALEKDVKLNGKLDNKDKIFIDMTPPISQFEVANGKKIDVEELDGSGIDALGKEKEGTSKKEPNNNDKMHIDKTPPISQFEVGAKKKIDEEELISDDLPQNEQEIEIPELTNKEKSQNQTQLAVYKPRITDRIKGFINDIKNMGVMESFNKNFMSNDVQVPINESREEQLKGINSNEEQVNLAQEENIKKQNLLTKVKDSLKKAFGIKDEKAEKIAQEQSDKLDSSKDSKESKGGFDFNSPDEELMAKTAAVGKDAAAKLKNKDANVVSTAEPTVSTDERED